MVSLWPFGCVWIGIEVIFSKRIEVRYAALECPAGLDVSLACLDSYNLGCIGSISARLIGHEIRHIMAQLWWGNPIQKANLGCSKNWLNPGDLHSA